MPRSPRDVATSHANDAAVRFRTISLALLGLCLTAPAQTPIAGDAPAPGTIVADLPCIDIRALQRRLSDFGAPPALVLFFVSKDCPMVGRVMPKMARLARDFTDRGVVFAAVNVGRNDTLRDVGTQAIEFEQPYHFVKDRDLTLARGLGVTRTTTVAVLDHERRLRYRGRVDDQVAYGKTKPAATREDLRLALEAVLAGSEVAVVETPAEGCVLTAPTVAAPERTPTYHHDIQPIVERHCAECHRDGGAAPFALRDYEQVVGQADMIGEVLELQRMPPWHASERFGEFSNRRGLSPTEHGLLRDWLASGRTQGQAPATLSLTEFPPGPWRIGTPDLVIAAPQEIELPEDGVVPYSYILLPISFAQDTWVEAVEILPENKRVLHHANLGYFKLGERFSHDGFITGFVPGGDPFVMDPGTAFCIPKGSALGIQAHYVTTGKPETDRIRVGLRFPRQKVAKRAEVLVVTNTRFAIPPGAPAHRVEARRKFDADVTLIGLFAHMHLRGRDMTFVAHAPEQKPQTLLMIPNYDFEWQASYRFHRGKVQLPANTRVEVFAHFDNSTFNPHNPDAKATVRFGQQTFDEMMYGFVFYTRNGPDLDLQIDPATGRARG